MEDRIGDLLAQRARLEGGAAPAVFVSLLFHAVLSVLAFWAAWHHASTQMSTPVITIQFAKPAAVAEVVPQPAPAAIEPVRPPAVKKIEKPKPALKTVPLSPFGKSTKKGIEKPLPHPTPAIPPPPAPAAAPTAPAQDIPVGGAGVTALEGGDFPYSIYIAAMDRQIGQHWFRSHDTPAGLATTVRFIIDRDGTIRDVTTEISSGSGLFDRAALRAVIEASPLPPLPYGYSGTYLGVHLKFR